MCQHYDLARIGDSCKRWGMLYNPIKAKGLVISRSRTVTPIFLNLLLESIMEERVTELKVLAIILDAKPSLESHIRLTDASASSKLENIEKALCLFDDLVLFFWVYFRKTS